MAEAKAKKTAKSEAAGSKELHRYRSHTCGALRSSDIGNTARLSGWVHRVRDHGGVLFIDLRDHYGITQVVADPDSPAFKTAETVRSEWVIRVDGRLRDRPEGTVNPDLPTGEVELFATAIEVLSAAKELPEPDARLASIADEKAWIKESFETAKADAYTAPIGIGSGPFPLTDGYKSKALEIAKGRVALAGARLANLLNAALK